MEGLLEEIWDVILAIVGLPLWLIVHIIVQRAKRKAREKQTEG